MILTSFRLNDKIHIQHMDNAGLITPVNRSEALANSTRASGRGSRDGATRPQTSNPAGETVAPRATSRTSA